MVWGVVMETPPKAPARRCAIPKARRQNHKIEKERQKSIFFYSFVFNTDTESI